MTHIICSIGSQLFVNSTNAPLLSLKKTYNNAKRFSSLNDDECLCVRGSFFFVSDDALNLDDGNLNGIFILGCWDFATCQLSILIISHNLPWLIRAINELIARKRKKESKQGIYMCRGEMKVNTKKKNELEILQINTTERV